MTSSLKIYISKDKSVNIFGNYTVQAAIFGMFDPLVKGENLLRITQWIPSVHCVRAFIL